MTEKEILQELLNLANEIDKIKEKQSSLYDDLIKAREQKVEFVKACKEAKRK